MNAQHGSSDYSSELRTTKATNSYFWWLRMQQWSPRAAPLLSTLHVRLFPLPIFASDILWGKSLSFLFDWRLSDRPCLPCQPGEPSQPLLIVADNELLVIKHWFDGALYNVTNFKHVWSSFLLRIGFYEVFFKYNSSFCHNNWIDSNRHRIGTL